MMPFQTNLLCKLLRTEEKAKVAGEMMELGESVGMLVGVSGTGSDLKERQTKCHQEEISCP